MKNLNAPEPQEQSAGATAALSAPLALIPICALYKSAGNEKMGTNKSHANTGARGVGK